MTHFLINAIHCTAPAKKNRAQFNIAAVSARSFWAFFRYLGSPCGPQLFRAHCPCRSSNGRDYSIGMHHSSANMWVSHNGVGLAHPSLFVTHTICCATMCDAGLHSKVLRCLFCLTFLCFAPVSLFGLELQPAMLHCASSGQSVTKHAAVWGLLTSALGAQHRSLLAE